MSRRARQRAATWAAKRGLGFGPDPVDEDGESEGGQPDGRQRSPKQRPVMREKRAQGGPDQRR